MSVQLVMVLQRACGGQRLYTCYAFVDTVVPALSNDAAFLSLRNGSLLPECFQSLPAQLGEHHYTETDVPLPPAVMDTEATHAKGGAADRPSFGIQVKTTNATQTSEANSMSNLKASSVSTSKEGKMCVPKTGNVEMEGLEVVILMKIFVLLSGAASNVFVLLEQAVVMSELAEAMLRWAMVMLLMLLIPLCWLPVVLQQNAGVLETIINCTINCIIS